MTSYLLARQMQKSPSCVGKTLKLKKRTCLRQITERAMNGNRPMHRRKKSLAMYRKNRRPYKVRKY